jgi:N-acetylneuraminate synthase/sialic acid synthase
MFLKSQLENSPIIIAEVGQNHQGELELAREYIKVFANAGADVIKFQTRDNKYLFSEGAYNAPYTSENAFHSIYGLHREKLELKKEWIGILKSDCDKYGVKFMSTPFDEPSLDVLIENNVDILKIASFDLGNLPFINKIAKTGKPVVISIGGGKHYQIKASIEILRKSLSDDKISILHCVSEYPCEFNILGLDNINILQQTFPEIAIGLSDHYNGILSGPIGYTKGARVFEKHVTLNRAWKGTDHSFALEAEGFRKFVRDIKRVPYMMKPKDQEVIGNEPVFKKLGKSIVAATDLNAGSILTIDNLSGKIFEKQYIPVRQTIDVINKKLKNSIKIGNPITFNDLEDNL